MSLQIGTCKVEPGSKAHGFLDITTHGDGTRVSIPVLIVNGVQPGPTILANGCIHGDETEGFEAVLKLGEILNPKELKGKFIGVPVLNRLAFLTRMRFYSVTPGGITPIDMNRICPGSEDGKIEEQIISKYLNNILSKADYMVDLHGGGNYRAPVFYSIGAPQKLGNSAKKSLELAIASGIQIVKTEWEPLHHGYLTTYATEMGIPSFMIEVGAHSDRYTRRDFYVDVMVRAITNTMKYLGMLEGPRDIPLQPFLVKRNKVENVQYLVKVSQLPIRFGGLFKPKVMVGEKVEKGQLLAQILNPFWGEVLQNVIAPEDGICLSINAYPIIYPGDYINFGIILETIIPEE